MPNPLPRCTPRLVLRRLAVDDLKDFQSYRRDTDVGLYQDWSPMTDTEAASFLEEMGTATHFRPARWFQIGIADRQSNVLIGDIGICVATGEREAEIGFSIRRQSQGQGLASEAIGEALSYIFDSSSCERIVGIVDTRNEPAVRLLQRLGMRLTQTVAAEFEGQPCEESTFEALRPVGR